MNEWTSERQGIVNSNVCLFVCMRVVVVVVVESVNILNKMVILFLSNTDSSFINDS